MSPVERHQHRRRRHHDLGHADVHRHDQRAEPEPRPARRPDRDPQRRHRPGRQRHDRGLLQPQPAPRRASASYAQYIRQDAGTGLTDANGNFSVTVGDRRGQHRAGDQRQPAARPVPDLQRRLQRRPLAPARRPTAATTSPRSIAQDQSGNQSVPNANAELPFVVDDTAPTAQFASPNPGQVITSLTNGGVQFSIIDRARTST